MHALFSIFEHRSFQAMVMCCRLLVCTVARASFDLALSWFLLSRGAQGFTKSMAPVVSVRRRATATSLSCWLQPAFWFAGGKLAPVNGGVVEAFIFLVDDDYVQGNIGC